MKESNKWFVTMTRDEVINMGYDPCGNCRPWIEWSNISDYKAKPPGSHQAVLIKSGKYLSSRAVSSQVLWAPESLTSVFGMGTGVASPLSMPEWLRANAPSKPHKRKEVTVSVVGVLSLEDLHHLKSGSNKNHTCGQVFGLLVPVRFIHYCTSTSGLSTCLLYTSRCV